MVEIKKVIVDSAMKLESNYKSQGIFEIGKGENPLPYEDMEKIYSKIKEMMIIGIMM